MRWLSSLAIRLGPVAFVVMALVVVAQFWIQHHPNSADVAHYGQEVARVTALEIEAMIQGYGLDVAVGGIDSDILVDMMRRQQRLGSGASSRDLVRAVEESMADTLIDAREQGHTKVVLLSVDGHVIAKPEL